MIRKFVKNYLKIIVVSYFFFVINNSEGQISYYVTDSVTKYNIKVYDESEISNSLICKIMEKNKITQKFTPYEVIEYCTEKGKIYTAFNIVYQGKNQRYFLEKLSGNNLTIYYLKTSDKKQHYYLLKNDSIGLIKLSNNIDSLKKLFYDNTPVCPAIKSDIKYLKPNKYSIKRLSENINYCNLSHLPRIRLGIKTGIHLTNLKEPSNNLFSITDIQNNWNTLTGLFVDIPIKGSNYFFAPEINYQKIGILYEFKYLSYDYDLLYNASYVNLPLLFKYTFLSRRVNPFIIVGPQISLVNEKDGVVFKYSTNENVVNIDVPASQITQNVLKGFNIGGGVIFDYRKKISWFCDARFGYLNNITKSASYFSETQLSFSTGILF